MNTFLFILLCVIISAVMGAGSVFVYGDVTTSVAKGYPPNPNSILAVFGIPLFLICVPNFIATELFELESWKDALAMFHEPIPIIMVIVYFLIYVVIFDYGATSINKASYADQKSSKKS